MRRRSFSLPECMRRKDLYPMDMGTPFKKRLEVARALATDPDLLLLDEVMAGLNPTETDEAVELFRKINDQGTTILLIEHVMRAVTNLCKKSRGYAPWREDHGRNAGRSHERSLRYRDLSWQGG